MDRRASGVQTELEEVLKRNLAEAENEGERVEKTEGMREQIRSHHEYLQGLEFRLFDLDVLIDELQDVYDLEKEK